MIRNVKSPLPLTVTVTLLATSTLFPLMGCQPQIDKTVVPAAHSSQNSSSLPSLSAGPSSFNASNSTTDFNTQKTTRIQTASSMNHDRADTHKGALYSPHPGILCDHFFCADPNGISYSLTLHFLGKKAASRLHDEGNFDMTAFTFENGIFCDTHEKLCREDRYYNQQGHHSGKVNQTDTARLFPHE
ncbi:hypothetical protein LMG33818_000775 [Halomonadaceae bacterium LMG 33818]|uniref:YcgJ family protein n=1 Tax=Cernens ardua TaxID=3402176 RepID=UPI003EDB750F